MDAKIASTMSSALCVLLSSCCPSQTLDPPLLAGRIHCFDDPVSVGQDQVARIQLNHAFLISEIRKHADGWAAGFQPDDRLVSPE